MSASPLSAAYTQRIQYYIWAHAMRPHHCPDNIIAGANCIRPLLTTAAADHK
jgi:hypothetical protein